MKYDESILNLSDEDLVDEIVKTRDENLFEVLYDRYEKIIYNKCYGFVNNAEEAKDLTQEIFLKLFLKIRQLS